jgi:peptide/nickel transport system permease protein
MVSLYRNYLPSAPWMVIFPGGAIALTVLAFNLFGDALRDRLDPKLKL